MFGMGWPEITVIVIVGVIVFGPDKLPEFVRQAARLVRTVRRMAQDARDDLGREIGHDLSELDLKSLDPREVVRRTILDDGSVNNAQSTEERALPRTDRPPVDPDAT